MANIIIQISSNKTYSYHIFLMSKWLFVRTNWYYCILDYYPISVKIVECQIKHIVDLIHLLATLWSHQFPKNWIVNSLRNSITPEIIRF